jgi:hypothetical protein
MGYLVNKLANLPVDNDVDWYIFVVREVFRDKYTKAIEDNFYNIARSIGDRAIIVDGLDQQQWAEEVAERYLGQDWWRYQRSFPALIISDSHPDEIRADTFRMFVPLATVEERFGGWSQFFRALTDFVLRKNVRLLEVYEKTNNRGFAALSRIAVPKLTAAGPELEFDLGKIGELWKERGERASGPREGPL